jgi:hypothetical protein
MRFVLVAGIVEYTRQEPETSAQTHNVHCLKVYSIRASLAFRDDHLHDFVQAGMPAQVKLMYGSVILLFGPRRCFTVYTLQSTLKCRGFIPPQCTLSLRYITPIHTFVTLYHPNPHLRTYLRMLSVWFGFRDILINIY